MTKTLARHPWAVLAALSLTTTVAPPALALEYTWNGGDGLWNDASKWSLLGVPGAGDTATIAFTGTGAVVMTEAVSVARLNLNGGRLGGAQQLTIGDFSFQGGTLGVGAAPAGGTAVVSGTTQINGAVQLGIDYTQTLELRGTTTWSAGNGIFGVGPAYSGSAGSFPTSRLVIAATGTFQDLGAVDANGIKSLGYYGGEVLNQGRLVHSGAGATAVVALDNRGIVDVTQGTFIFNTGNRTNTSSGTINVAAGATLVLGNADITAGTLDNQGLVVLGLGSVQVAAGARINGVWRMDGHNQVATITGQHQLQSLQMNDGRLSAAGTLTLGTLAYNGGILGHVGALTGGLVQVTGAATIAGGGVLAVEYGQSLTLLGQTTWSAGNGRLTTGGAYVQGTQPVAESVLRIGGGTTFVDQGALGATGYKLLGGLGSVVNDGTYLRQGEGFTLTQRFVNNGVVRVASGSFAVDQQWQNLGTVIVDSGAALTARETTFVNTGRITGSGIVRPFSQAAAHALYNRGTLDPSGSLTIDGSMQMNDGAVLHIDLMGQTADLLALTGAVTWDGTLDLGGSWNGGSSVVIATYDSWLGGTTFDRITWNGQPVTGYTLAYGEHQLTLNISAVPEPASWGLLAAGVAMLAVRRRAMAR